MKSQLDRIEDKLDQLLAKKKPANPRSSAVKYPSEFEDVWREYPKRIGSNPKKKALSAWFARGDEATFDGDEESEMAEQYRMFLGAIRYCEFCDKTVEDKRFVMQAATFFGPDKHYENDWAIPEIADTAPKDNNQLEAWATDKGFRTPRPGESWTQYRQAVNQLYRHD